MSETTETMMAPQQPNTTMALSDDYCPYHDDEELENLIHCFDEDELDQVIRCYAALVDNQNSDTFIMKIALSSPYPFSLLPGNRMRKRIEFIEDNILPPGFGSNFRAAMSVELFGEYEGEISLERFLKGVADCCMRGPKNTLRMIWDSCSYNCAEFAVKQELDPAKVVDLCYRLSIASGRDMIVLCHLPLLYDIIY